MAYAAILALLFQMASMVPEVGADGPCPPAWSYDAQSGPAAWGQLDPEWKECDSGTKQSPVVIANPRHDGSLPSLVFSYRSVPVAVQNTSRDLKVWPLEAATVTLRIAGRPDVVARLVEFHFHFPKEHVANNAGSVGELHLVHALPNNRLLAVAVPLNAGNPNPALGMVATLRPETCRSKKSENESQYVNLAQLLPAAVNRYFSYEGSLTTPGCNENVSWIVLNDGISLSSIQSAALRATPNYENARPAQPLAGRIVTFRQQ